MKINGCGLSLYINLFDDHKKTLYLQMRKDEYPMETIMDFITGYSIITNEFSDYLMNKMFSNNSFFYETAIDGYQDAMKLFKSITDRVHNEYITSNDWEKIGMKYALCLARYYIKFVIFGDDMDVDDIYMEIPDKTYPENYNWEDRGYDFEI